MMSLQQVFFVIIAFVVVWHRHLVWFFCRACSSLDVQLVVGGCFAHLWSFAFVKSVDGVGVVVERMEDFPSGGWWKDGDWCHVL